MSEEGEEGKRVRIKHYRGLMPTIPLEVSYRSKHALFNIRYEHARLNRHKNDLEAELTDNYSLLTVEIGLNVPLNRPEKKMAREETKEKRRKSRKVLGPTF